MRNMVSNVNGLQKLKQLELNKRNEITLNYKIESLLSSSNQELKLYKCKGT